jgi:probable rRNA maturation factor
MPRSSAKPSKPPRVQVSNRHPRLLAPTANTRRLIAALDACQAFAAPPGELSVALLTDDAMMLLHAAWFDDPSTTDVITFEGDPDTGSAGEICVSVDVAHAYAQSRGLPFSEELALYIVHGYLHLCGYDDLQPEKKRQMRRAEAKAMHALRAAGAMPQFKLRA